MVESIVAILAGASVAVSAGLTAVVVRLHKKSRQMQRALSDLQQEVDAHRIQSRGDDLDAYTSLSGLRIAIAVSQDHNIPTLSLLLKDALSALDAEVDVLDTEQALSLADNWGRDEISDQPDVLIWGSITCNGYSEFYYKVMLNYLTPYGPLNPTSEQPSHGNPQSSLVITIVSKLKKELIIAQRRHERGRALKELREEGMLKQIEE